MIMKLPMPLVLVATICFVFAADAAADELNLVEGYWDTYVTIRVQGGILPVPAIKSSKCLTREDPIPNSTQSAMSCQITDKKISGNDVSWRITCADDKGRMEGEGKVTYAGETFDGAMDVLISEVGGSRQAKMKYMMRGSRLRACDMQSQQ